VGTFVQLTGLPGRPVRQPVFAGCTRRLCDRRLWLVTKSALEVYVVHDDALYKLTSFTFTFSLWMSALSKNNLMKLEAQHRASARIGCTKCTPGSALMRESDLLSLADQADIATARLHERALRHRQNTPTAKAT